MGVNLGQQQRNRSKLTNRINEILEKIHRRDKKRQNTKPNE
jgi:hypothetical protein